MKPKNKTLGLAVVGGLMSLALGHRASAAALVYEPFDYAAGGLSGAGGTTEVGLDGTWSANASAGLIVNSLVYGAFTTSGNKVGPTSSGSNHFGGARTISASSLAANGLLDDGAVLWFSLIMGYGPDGNRTNTRLVFVLADESMNSGNYNYWFNTLGSTGLGVTMGRFGVNGKIVSTLVRDSTFGDGLDGLVFGNSDEPAVFPGDNSNTDAALVVGKITWAADPADPDLIELFVPDTDLLLPGSPHSVLSTTVDQSGYDTITWSRGDVIVMDEVRFGATYDDVVPVPAGAPTIATLSPANEAVNVSKTVDMVATFNKPIQLTGSGAITLTNLTLSAPVSASVTLTDNAFLTISPSANLANSTHYAAFISNDAIEDYTSPTPLAFAGITDADDWDFTTTGDAVAPTIDSTDPVDSTDGSIGQSMTATFSEDVVFTGSGSVIVRNVTDATDTTYALPNDNVSISGSVLTIATPIADRREASKNYAILISADALEDLGGNAFAGILDNTTWDFDTLDTINYEWTGAASGDWNDNANWSSNGAPIDARTSNELDLYGPSGERIVFNAPLSANPVPTSNIPSLGGYASGSPRVSITPQLDLVNGTITFTAYGFNNQGFVRHNTNPWTTTVGDGDSGNGLASLSYNGGFSQGIARDPDSGAMLWTINGDGAITIDGAGSTLIFAYGSDRWPVFILNGGTFTTPDELDMLRSSTDLGSSYIEFQGADSTFTAKLGTDFPDISSVTAECGAGKTFRSAMGTDPVAKDNGDSTFTVYIPPAGFLFIVR